MDRKFFFAVAVACLFVAVAPSPARQAAAPRADEGGGAITIGGNRLDPRIARFERR